MAQVSMDELKKTMPWREQVYGDGIVQIIDRNGQEVPLFVITGFVQVVTAHMAKEAKS